MTAEEERLYTQYYYNSVIEFIYFIILYLETFGTASLNNLIKHVKLFKIEITNLISSFEGKTSEDKLYQMLNSLDCFLLNNNEVKINENICWKNSFFEDLVLSKCVDLILKGLNNTDDICKNLNNNNVIFIMERDLLHIIDKYSYISVENDKTVTLHHLHGLLGFENYVRNSVISYFHDILYHGKILSINEIENHSKFLSFCGTHNMLIIFSILNCSDQFVCQNGYVWLKTKSEKYPKKQHICVELMEAKYLSRSLHIGQVVYSTYGSILHKWSGEIANLSKTSGNIYCVVDFTNGHQGVFCISFSKTALKVISEIDNLKKYLNVRDAVEFDAEYYSGKKLDRCWRATRVKLLCNNKFEHDEILCKKLNFDSEKHRNQCVKCYSNINCLNNYSVKIKHPEYHEIQLSKKLKVDDYKLCSFYATINKAETVNKNTFSQEMENKSFTTISNLLIPEYVLMFGYVHMLMEDKVVAVAKHENKIYNILFLIESAYPPDKLQNTFVKGQKIIAFIPFLEKLEFFSVATLAYGLSDQETNETEESNSLPHEFADKIFLQNTVDNLCKKFCNKCDLLNGLSVIEKIKTDLILKMEITKLYNFIASQYKISPENNCLLQFLQMISKTNLNSLNLSDKVFHSVVKLSKSLTQYKEHKVKDKRKLKIKNSEIEFESQKLCPDALTKIATSNATNTNLNLKSKSLNMIASSSTSLSSFKTCSSTDSIESFYSCETENNSPKSNKCSPVMFTHNEGLYGEVRTDIEFEQIKTVPKMLYEDILMPIDSSQDIKLQNKSFKNSNYCKDLGLQSVPFLKHTVKKRIVLPCNLKSLCKNCAKSFCNTTGYISMISNSSFFVTTNIHGHNVVLPMSKQSIPQNLQENMKLKSSCEFTVIPGLILNLSHVISARIIV